MNRALRQSRYERLTYFARIFWIDCELRANRYPNAAKISEHFEVATKTGYRTLEFMRDQLRLPIQYSAEHRGWYYTEPAYALPAIELSQGELVAIYLVERLARQYRGTAIGRHVEEAFAKVLSAATGTVSIDFNALAEAYSFEAPPTSELESETFRQLGRAAIERRRVEITYYTATRGEVSRRRVDPLQLRNYLGEWYLIAFDHLRGEVRDFHAGRIRELKVTDERFEWPESFNLQAYLESGFGMIRGREPIDVEIEFDEYQARWIRERGPVHPTEQREEKSNGGLKIRMRVTALDGVKRFVMQYGSHVRVIAPKKLRQAVQQEIKAMRSFYPPR